MDQNLLSLVLFTPLAGLLVLLLIPAAAKNAIKLWTNLVMFAGFLISLPLVSRFDRDDTMIPRPDPGSILATVLMLLCTLLFSWYVTNFGNYNQLYGSIGTILILMILIYFNSLVLLIGFELNVSIAALKRIADERNNNVPDGNPVST